MTINRFPMEVLLASHGPLCSAGTGSYLTTWAILLPLPEGRDKRATEEPKLTSSKGWGVGWWASKSCTTVTAASAHVLQVLILVGGIVSFFYFLLLPKCLLASYHFEAW
ncbi:unnamed protein product, partial [Discosporangium mesarthrocarpum]